MLNAALVMANIQSILSVLLEFLITNGTDHASFAFTAEWT